MLRRGLIIDLGIALGTSSRAAIHIQRHCRISKHPHDLSATIYVYMSQLANLGFWNNRYRRDHGQCLLVRQRARDDGIGTAVLCSNTSTSRYGYHVPRRNMRDNFYRKLEDERAAARQ